MEISDKQRNILVGTGGHAKAIFAELHEQGQFVVAVVDNHYPEWLARHRGMGQRPIHFKTDDDGLNFLQGEPDLNIIMGMGGITPDQLTRRLGIFMGYLKSRTRSAKPLVFSSASVSEHVALEEGAVVLHQAIIQPDVFIGSAAIINTGAIVEHDSRIGRGSHIAPGAVVLGGATVGDNCLVGANATVLPGVTIPDNVLIPASSVAK